MAIDFYKIGKSKIFQKGLVKTRVFSNFFHGTFPVVLNGVVEVVSIQINIHFQLDSLLNKYVFSYLILNSLS